VSDPTDSVDLRDDVPGQLEPGRIAIRVEPTPSRGRDQLAHDVLTTLQRRPHLSARWASAAIKPQTAAWLWCHAHDITHVVIPRAHTVDEQVLLHLTASSRFDFIRHVEPITWWLIDSSPNGKLKQTDLYLYNRTADVDELRREIAAAQSQYEHVRQVEEDSGKVGFGGALRDAHPALFAHRLRDALDGYALAEAQRRFAAAAELARTSNLWFSDLAGVVWYLLTGAYDSTDALVLLRGAQLGFLQNRIHFSLTSTAWEAGVDARGRLAEQLPQLMAYVDPIVAAAGALTMQCGLSAGGIARLGIDSYEDRRINLRDGFRPAEMAPVASSIVRAQQLSALAREDDKPQALLIAPRSTKSYRGKPRAISSDRINALLRTIELERNTRIDFEDWVQTHDLRWYRV
jgi:hypothetical protein